jgi:hypothetical protein
MLSTRDVPSRITVQVDSREQYPLLFPSSFVLYPPLVAKQQRVFVATETLALDAGDYRLKEYEEGGIVERKGSILELAKNFFDPKDRVRQAKAFAKLRKYRKPTLLVETSLAEWDRPARAASSLPSLNPDQVLQSLVMVSSLQGLDLVWVPKLTNINARRKVGGLVAQLLLVNSLFTGDVKKMEITL